MARRMRTAHFIWMGSPIPPEYARNIQDFANLNPNWRIQVWDMDWCRSALSAKVLPLFDEASDYVPADSVWQLRSDIARLAILRKHGGLYVDTDFRWQKPIDKITVEAPGSIATVWEKEGKFVANGFIYAARPGSPLLQKALMDLPSWIRKRKGCRANRITGPSGQWTDIAMKGRDVAILPSWTLLPYAWNELDRGNEEFPDAYGVHVWGHQQTIKGMK